MQFSDIQALAADDMAGVDGVIHQRLHSDIALVSQVSAYIVAGGGKRLDFTPANRRFHERGNEAEPPRGLT